ncbi:hypothetical protein TNCV_487161 [Trichonephila clavipes]|nr:hypothetical protein TNCV_487161 [Trichonephila clavipes]
MEIMKLVNRFDEYLNSGNDYEENLRELQERRRQDQDYKQKISEIKTPATRLAEARFKINTQAGSPTYRFRRDTPHVGLNAVTDMLHPFLNSHLSTHSYNGLREKLNSCNHPVNHERSLSFPAGSRYSNNPSTFIRSTHAGDDNSQQYCLMEFCVVTVRLRLRRGTRSIKVERNMKQR